MVMHLNKEVVISLSTKAQKYFKKLYCFAFVSCFQEFNYIVLPSQHAFKNSTKTIKKIVFYFFILSLLSSFKQTKQKIIKLCITETFCTNAYGKFYNNLKLKFEPIPRIIETPEIFCIIKNSSTQQEKNSKNKKTEPIKITKNPDEL